MLNYLVVYASTSGNTEKIAREIFNALPGSDNDKKIINVREWTGQLKAHTYFIGYWANCGTCSMEVIDLISSLHDSNVAFFGTCGLGGDENHYRKLEQAGLAWLSSDNHYLGSYFCQGRMVPDIREKYESYRCKITDEQYQALIDNYEKAKTHPDRQDLLRANVFASDIASSLPR
ncbi:flavodoxin family protein [Butyrivibrio sp. MC2013]|uniref:flavodoxin family protein n=1 Tax=Butyrivibrio sp. MC2013 TaxID=1280686 RepID=UPI0004067E77|nr:flavodoxin family protein [Butyrivibrio sp. MC2013]